MGLVNGTRTCGHFWLCCVWIRLDIVDDVCAMFLGFTENYVDERFWDVSFLTDLREEFCFEGFGRGVFYGEGVGGNEGVGSECFVFLKLDQLLGSE